MKHQKKRCIAFVILLALLGTSGLNAQLTGPTNTGTSPTRALESYVISPLDVLRIGLYVADELQFMSETRVSQTGLINLPHLGNFKVAGLNLEDAREALFVPYNKDFYVDPYIDIVVLSYAERSVTIMGKVNRQGPVPFPDEEGMTLLEAIARAGGWSNDRLANMKKVTITRTTETGAKKVIEVNAREITAEDYPLQEGDLINVPERVW